MFQKVLIANRGEIAVRVQRALREMGVRAVSVYSDVDAHAPHVTRADEAYLLGPAEARTSYLNQERILEVARESGCDAVHPGYGFLSENAAFARRCAAQGVVFIGPPADAIETMGDKLRAREVMTRAGVPVVPGAGKAGDSLVELQRAASKMDFPVLIKAAAGGGGKGMRIVHAPEDFERAAEAARGESEKAFADGTLYVEKYLENPRHIEIQVFADRHGNVVHLFERECSIQRRHQKIIEEAPSPALNEKLRNKMGAAAVDATRAVGYEGAGTVEFLLDGNGKFYFLEMNTRLQVEHPVTEFVTGLDLVRMQVEVAAGAELAAEARDPMLRGHAIECRVYAEDPENGFLPASGHIARMRYPAGPGIRVDGALRDGIDVSIHYDPLLAKVVTFGRDRPEAILRMQRALSDFVLLGIPTNVRFLQDVLDHEAFGRGELTTHFIEEHMGAWKAESAPLPEAGLAALLLHEFVGSASASAPDHGDGAQVATPWSTLTEWRHLPGGEA